MSLKVKSDRCPSFCFLWLITGCLDFPRYSDTPDPQNEARSNASGLTPPRWLCRRVRLCLMSADDHSWITASVAHPDSCSSMSRVISAVLIPATALPGDWSSKTGNGTKGKHLSGNKYPGKKLRNKIKL